MEIDLLCTECIMVAKENILDLEVGYLVIRGTESMQILGSVCPSESVSYYKTLYNIKHFSCIILNVVNLNKQCLVTKIVYFDYRYSSYNKHKAINLYLKCHNVFIIEHAKWLMNIIIQY